MKKILRIGITIIVLIVLCIIYISYITDNNSQDIERLKNEISKNYNTNGGIDYINEYNNNYIIKTNNKVVVLSKDYKEVIKEDISKLNSSFNDAELIYKTNKLMYEKTIRKNNTITYEYYDALSGSLIKSKKMELR